MGHTIYLAARYSRRLELAKPRAELEAVGWEVTARWLLGNHQAENDQLHHGGAAGLFGQEDIDDLARAEVFVLFTEPPRQASTSRGGRHVEYGFALARGMELHLVGPRENVFHCLSGVTQHDTWPQCFAVLCTRN